MCALACICSFDDGQGDDPEGLFPCILGHEAAGCVCFLHAGHQLTAVEVGTEV